MRKKLLFTALICLCVMVTASIVNAQTAALSWLTNMASVTANNVLKSSNDMTNVQVRTMFGGRFSLPLTVMTQNVAALEGYKWQVNFTNKGNATSPFTIKFDATNKSAGTTWTAGFINGTRSYVVTPALASGGFTTVFVCVTNQPTAAADGSKYFVRIVATNTTPVVQLTMLNGATNYTGDNLVSYGGDMGETWVGTNKIAGYRRVYMQNVTYSTAFFILQISAPKLSITKSIISITKGGVASSPIPGSTILYRIFVTNSGSAAADRLRINDQTPVAPLIAWGGTYGMTNLSAKDTNYAGGAQDFVWTNASFAAKARGVVLYRVRIN